VRLIKDVQGEIIMVGSMSALGSPLVASGVVWMPDAAEACLIQENDTL
jgi:hypothetical protein